MKMTLVTTGLIMAAICGTLMGQDDRPPIPQHDGDQGVGRGREGGPGFSHGNRGKSGMRPGGEEREEMIERFLNSPEAAEELGLDEEKLKALKEGLDEIKKKMINLRGEIEKAGIDQARLMTAKEIDETALMEAVEKTGTLRTELAKQQMRKMLLLKKSISPEKVEKIKEKFRDRVMKEREKAGGEQGEGRERFREELKKRREKRSGGGEGEKPVPLTDQAPTL
jgi:hypothetical protein